MINELLARLWMGGLGAIDIVLAAMVFLGLFRGYRNGLAKECGRILELCVAMVWALPLSYRSADWAAAVTRMPVHFMHGTIFAVLCFSFTLSAGFIFKILSKLCTLAFAKSLEKAGGFLAGGVRFGVLTALVCYALVLFQSPELREAFVDRSRTGRYLVALPKVVHHETIGFFQRMALISQLK